MHFEEEDRQWFGPNQAIIEADTSKKRIQKWRAVWVTIPFQKAFLKAVELTAIHVGKDETLSVINHNEKCSRIISYVFGHEAMKSELTSYLFPELRVILS